jgi:hypothetical protein
VVVVGEFGGGAVAGEDGADFVVEVGRAPEGDGVACFEQGGDPGFLGWGGAAGVGFEFGEQEAPAAVSSRTAISVVVSRSRAMSGGFRVGVRAAA